jgi:hypothetical protein
MTLVELMVSLALVTLIMAACGSMLTAAARAMSSDTSNVGTDAMAARSAADQVVDDLKVATAVTEQSATAVTMTVPDRDGDGQPETIRYAWSGVAGAPLTRAYNARAAGVVAANVRALNFGYLSKTVGKPAAVEGAEQVLGSHAPTTAKYFGVDSNKAVAVRFAPTLADTAVGWKVTRCRITLKKKATLGTITIRLRYADSSGYPTGSDLGTASYLTTNLTGSTATAADLTLSPQPTLDVTKAVCLLVTQATGSSMADVEYDDNSADATLTHSTSSDGGVSWSGASTGKAMTFTAWGTVTTQDADTYDFQPLPPAAP